MNSILATVGLTIGFFAVILLCEFIYKRYQVEVEYTRKFAHCTSTLFSLSFILFFDSYWNVIVLGTLFFLVLYIGKRYKVFNSIDNVSRKTAGSYLLPIAISITFVTSKYFDNTLLYVLPILVLGISDPLAGVSGTIFRGRAKRIKIFKIDLGKTVIGTCAFFASTILISISVLMYYHIANAIILSFIISIIATSIEMLSPRGLDNLTVPLSIMLILA